MTKGVIVLALVCGFAASALAQAKRGHFGRIDSSEATKALNKSPLRDNEPIVPDLETWHPPIGISSAEPHAAGGSCKRQLRACAAEMDGCGTSCKTTSCVLKCAGTANACVQNADKCDDATVDKVSRVITCLIRARNQQEREVCGPVPWP